MTAYGTLDTAVDALRAGAFDYLASRSTLRTDPPPAASARCMRRPTAMR